MLQEASMRNSMLEPYLLSSLLLVCGNSTADVSFVRDNAVSACNIESYYLHYVASSKDGLFREEKTELRILCRDEKKATDAERGGCCKGRAYYQFMHPIFSYGSTTTYADACLIHPLPGAFAYPGNIAPRKRVCWLFLDPTIRSSRHGQEYQSGRQ